MKQNTNRITAATLGAAITVALVWILELLAGIKPPAEVIVALTTIVTALTQLVWSKRPPTAPGTGTQAGFSLPGVLSAIFAGALLAFVLAGCQSGGIRSFSDGVGAAYLAIDTAADVIYEACRNEVPDGPCAPDSPIETADKDRAKAALTEALDMLGEARALYQVGSTDLGMERLRQARQLLAVAEAIARRADG